MDYNGNVKICDFGISKQIDAEEVLYEYLGTPAYLAPEIIKEKGYSGFGADVWSLGIMSFISMTGLVPFKGQGDDLDELNYNIINNEIDLDNPKIRLTLKTKIILKKMLKKSPSERITTMQVAKMMKFNFDEEEQKSSINFEIA